MRKQKRRSASDQRICFRCTDTVVQFLYYLNPKFTAHLLCLYSSICVGPVRKPHCLFSHEVDNIYEPVRDKTNNLGIRPGPTQTDLYSHRRWLEAGIVDLENRGIALSM